MTLRVLLLMPTTTYKAHDFLEAAARLGIEVVVGTDHRQALEPAAPGHTLALDFSRPGPSLDAIVRLARDGALRAVVGVDDETVVLASLAAEALGLPHNPPDAVRASRDKHRTRVRMREAGLRTPWFTLVSLQEPVEDRASVLPYPCVVKPRILSASRGVLRADDPESFVQAVRRIAAILREPEVRRRGGEAADCVLVESYINGVEVALEGLLRSGRLHVLALFDKPDKLEGPTFEETLYVTPSRLPAATQRAIGGEAARACAALGLREGPVHAELRIRHGEPWVLEIAARTIGGLCSRALRFGAGVTLEELVLRHAVGSERELMERERLAAGVMMIPIPRAGILRETRGLEAARAVAGIEEVTISLAVGSEVVPLPEGHRYLGFIFARGPDPAFVEQALREAHRRLGFRID
jgi:biotin carboxylase